MGLKKDALDGIERSKQAKHAWFKILTRHCGHNKKGECHYYTAAEDCTIKLCPEIQYHIS